MARFIVSKTLSQDNFRNYIVVKNIPELINSITQNGVQNYDRVDVLILHDPEDEDFNLTVSLKTLAQKGVQCFYYINDNPNETLTLVLTGIANTHPTYIVDEDSDMYFGDEEELDALIEETSTDSSRGSSDDKDLPSVDTDIDILSRYIQAYSSDDKIVETPMFRKQAEGAINNLSTLVTNQHTQIRAMGNSSLEILQSSIDTIKALEDSNKTISEQLKRFSEKAQSYSQKRQVLGGTFVYPSVIYNGLGKVLVVREFSHMMFLTSFVMSLTNYVHYALNKRVKLVIVHTKEATIAKKYQNIGTVITDASKDIKSLYSNEYIVTDCPKKDVMLKLLDAQNDLTIVLDREYGTEPILKGKVSYIYALNGQSEREIFGVKEDSRIITTGTMGGFDANKIIGVLKPIKGYSEMNTSTRSMVYARACQQMYNKILSFVGIE